VGLRPNTPDGRPVMGPAPGVRNGYVATGHGGFGLAVGRYSGAAMGRYGPWGFPFRWTSAGSRSIDSRPRRAWWSVPEVSIPVGAHLPDRSS